MSRNRHFDVTWSAVFAVAYATYGPRSIMLGSDKLLLAIMVVKKYDTEGACVGVTASVVWCAGSPVKDGPRAEYGPDVA